MKYKYERKGVIKICINCNKEFKALLWNIKNGGGIYCSRKCQTTGSNNPFWHGGKTYHERGYVLIRKPEHPYANLRGYVNEHRLVMEKEIGRYLLSEEVVHHINSNKQDNRIENLMLFKNQSEHLKREWEDKKYAAY